MISRAGSLAIRYALPASILLILIMVIRLISGQYYRGQDWMLVVNLGVDLSIITLFSYRCMRNSILDNEDLPITNGYLFTLFNWTVLLTSLFFFVSANLFFNAIDTQAWRPIQISLLQQLGMDFSATQFLLLLLIFYINFGVIWSAFYLMMRKRFNR